MRPQHILAVVLVVAGCGTKTPLTLPHPAQPAVKGATAPAPATAGKVAEPGR